MAPNDAPILPQRAMLTKYLDYKTTPLPELESRLFFSAESVQLIQI